MPSKAEGLVLTVDPNVIHKVDTNNPHNLFSMWTVFSRCAESVEQGRRLENLSWRLWTREALCCEATAQTKRGTSATTMPPQDIPDKHRIPDVPQLSGSVESIADDEAIEFTAESNPVEILRPNIQRQDSCASSRSKGRERHITSDHLEKMVVTIITEKEPNLSPLPHIVSSSMETDSDVLQSSSSEVEDTLTTRATESADCESSGLTSQVSTSVGAPENHTTAVIRGFSPSQFPPSRHSHEPKSEQPDVIPEPHSSPAPQPVQSKKQRAQFALGGSSGDESSPSLEVHQPVHQPVISAKKSKMFQLGGSSGSNEDQSPSLKSALHSGKPSSLLGAHKKQTSFSNQVTMRTISTPSDQSGSYVDESAIDDDDEDSEWEDSIEESGKSSMDEKLAFRRVPSKPNLTSQRSLLSLALAGEERTKALSNYASQSTPAIAQRARQLQGIPQGAASPNDSDEAGLEMRRGMRRTPLKPINEIPRSSAQPIIAKPTIHSDPQALSPRTTRRHMLATELTESLRRQLLWERQQKSSTANAVLKRRHTSHDVARLKQYPETAYMKKSEDEVNSSSWNQYFREDSNGGYHTQGW
ncbi:hypothetical protein F5B22DRAFT_631446 [Xylaria bambusicola]|uniref:uncharacterized protein n=1 Tax=Xylaria bambusicola TaxID=326684 RepID=UPI0020076D1B|nr:uncharacterized protein F5B22DRAFT_631446 [Xylaria bambusicola]KAI0502894.1 hypothetical protein F5B22DRAFT_631446 [Xylaria bambusicola]